MLVCSCFLQLPPTRLLELLVGPQHYTERHAAR